MAARQDELRRLMKESKGKTQSAEKARVKRGDSTSATVAAATVPQINGCVRLSFLIPTLIPTLTLILNSSFDINV